MFLGIFISCIFIVNAAPIRIAASAAVDRAPFQRIETDLVLEDVDPSDADLEWAENPMETQPEVVGIPEADWNPAAQPELVAIPETTLPPAYQGLDAYHITSADLGGPSDARFGMTPYGPTTRMFCCPCDRVPPRELIPSPATDRTSAYSPSRPHQRVSFSPKIKIATPSDSTSAPDTIAQVDSTSLSLDSTASSSGQQCCNIM